METCVYDIIGSYTDLSEPETISTDFGCASIKVVTDSGICIPTILVFVFRSSITKTNKYLLCRNDDAVLRASAPLYYCLFILWSNAIFVVFICNICTRNRRPNFHTYSHTAVNMFHFLYSIWIIV